jgi:hypothetical protein
LFVERRLDKARREQRFDFRPEHKRASGMCVIQRLDAQPIARKQQLLLFLVPDREREHAVQFLHDAVAVFLVLMDDRLGVAPRTILMSLRLEGRTQRRVVVDLAVERNPHAAVLVRHRLLARRADVDDCQAPMREADRAVDVQAGAVRTAMTQDIAHPAKAIGVNGLTRVEVNDSCKTAHIYLVI